MTRIPSAMPDRAHPASRAIMDQLRQRSLSPGVLLNVHAQMAISPSLLSAYMGMRRAIEEYGVLDAKTRSAIMLAVSSTDGAGYVQGINTVLTTRAGWAPAKAQEIARGTFSDDPKLASLLHVVRQAARGIGHVDDADWTRACEHGWSPEQFADAFASLAVTLMLDYFVHFAQTPIDAAISGT
jgi:hypothetical protein